MAGYDERNENLERAHGVEPVDWKHFIEAMNLKQGQKIVDLMGGKGAVASRIYEHARRNNFCAEVKIVDAYSSQLTRAPDYFEKIVADVRDIPLDSNSQDIVAVKMGLHELPLEEQKKAAKEIFRTLKNGGMTNIWMAGLVDQKQQEVFQWFVREKDRIAGLDDLVKNRYFATIDETKGYLSMAGFSVVDKYYGRNATMSTRDRLQGDFRSDIGKLEAYNAITRSRLKDIIETLDARDLGNTIQTGMPIALIRAVKK